MFNLLLVATLAFAGYAVYKYYVRNPAEELVDPIAKIGGSIVAAAGSLLAWGLAYLTDKVHLPTVTF